MRFSLLALILIVGCATGCSAVRLVEDPSVSAQLDRLTHDVPVQDPEDVLLLLSNPIKASLEKRISADWHETRKFKELGRYLFEGDERHIAYEALATQNATDTFVRGRGNCLSVSALFVAAARHLDIDAGFQTVEVQPIWSHSQEVMIRYEHIVAVGKVGAKEYVFDFLPNAFVSRGKSERITDEQALALYYSNRSVESLIKGDLESGIQLSLQALRLWPENSNFWSNLGSAFRRDGQFVLAENSFKRALLLNRENYSALSNLTHFFIRNDRSAEADQYFKQVKRYYRRNAYYHFILAQTQTSSADFKGALVSLKRATRLRFDDPVLFEALAEAQLSANNAEGATVSLRRAEGLRQEAAARGSGGASLY